MNPTDPIRESALCMTRRRFFASTARSIGGCLGSLALGSLLFAVCLGALAGLYPAWHAARLNPVRALRFE